MSAALPPMQQNVDAQQPVDTQSSALSTQSTISSTYVTSNQTVRVEGPVSNVTTGRFLVHTSAGYLPVVTNASTKFFTGTKAFGANAYAIVTGTGSAHSSVTAAVVGSYASSPSTFNTTGTIAGATPYGYTVKRTSDGLYVPVAVTTATTTTTTLASGTAVTIAGRGSSSGASFADAIAAAGSNPTTATPTPAPGATPTPAATPTPGATPTPAATPTPVAAPTPSGSSGSTLGRIALHQVFDFSMTSTQAASEGPRYNLVWGSHVPSGWRSTNSSLIASYYYIMLQSTSSYNLAWYQANHPDWILYNCTSANVPTHTPAYMQNGAYGTNVPLDIHNPAVISFQIRNMAAPAAIAGGYNAIAADQVVFWNIMGGNAGTGSYGCGVWQGSTFVRRYASKTDTAYGADIVNWVKTAHTILNTDPTLAPKHLKLVINHPAGNLSSTLEQNLIANIDAGLNENGFVNYGKYTTQAGVFKRAYDYATYEQAHGVTALVINKFVQSTALTPVQREWAVASYLLSNNGHMLLYSTNGSGGTGGYGSTHIYPEYSANLGMPCGPMTGGPAIYVRKFQNGIVALNDSLSASYASLPTTHVYRDIDARSVTSHLLIPATDAFVMTTTAGTGCN